MPQASPKQKKLSQTKSDYGVQLEKNLAHALLVTLYPVQPACCDTQAQMQRICEVLAAQVLRDWSSAAKYVELKNAKLNRNNTDNTSYNITDNSIAPVQDKRQAKRNMVQAPSRRKHSGSNPR